MTNTGLELWTSNTWIGSGSRARPFCSPAWPRRSGISRRPSAFQAELWLTSMCFNWSERAKTGQPDALEYLVHRLGPILAPCLGPELKAPVMNEGCNRLRGTSCNHPSGSALPPGTRAESASSVPIPQIHGLLAQQMRHCPRPYPRAKRRHPHQNAVAIAT